MYNIMYCVHLTRFLSILFVQCSMNDPHQTATAWQSSYISFLLFFFFRVGWFPTPDEGRTLLIFIIGTSFFFYVLHLWVQIVVNKLFVSRETTETVLIMGFSILHVDYYKHSWPKLLFPFDINLCVVSSIYNREISTVRYAFPEWIIWRQFLLGSVSRLKIVELN